MILFIWLVSFMSASPWAFFTKVNFLEYEGRILGEQNVRITALLWLNLVDALLRDQISVLIIVLDKVVGAPPIDSTVRLDILPRVLVI